MPMAKLMGFIGAKVRLERELIDVCVRERERERVMVFGNEDKVVF